jgi:hypothetical protein
VKPSQPAKDARASSLQTYFFFIFFFFAFAMTLSSR